MFIMDKTTAWKEIELKWKEIQVLWKNNFDIRNERIKLTLNNNIPKIERVLKPERVKTQGFEIRFNDRDIVLSTKQLSASELLRSFINIVGIKRIKTLNVPTASGRNMFIDIANDNNYISVFTKTSNSEKKDAIRQIIQELKLNAEIIDIKK